MGGRKSVIDTPAVELLGYMDAAVSDDEAAAEKEKARYYFQYLINLFTAPSFGKEDSEFARSRQEFLKTITPAMPAKEYEYDDDIFEQLAKQQELLMKQKAIE